MSLSIAIISFLAFAFRLKQGIAKREERILWVLWFVHLFIVLPLTIFTRELHTFDSRYIKPADCIVFGAATCAMLKFRYGKRILFALLGVLVVYNAIMLTKHLVPGSRRHANFVACQWAMRRIKEDWSGKNEDVSAKKEFTIHEYTSGGSPSISPISKRMNYLLGARNANPVFGKSLGTPDYIVEEDKRLRFEPWNKDDYVLIDELKIEKRHYSLYKRLRK